MSQIRTKATLPSLAYEYKDLEPIISRDIMEIHHQKHHNTYVVNYNNTLDKLQTAVAKGYVYFCYMIKLVNYYNVCSSYRRYSDNHKLGTCTKVQWWWSY
jgi:superoxide dismutase